jgi:phage tail sheath gpL-like
VPEKREEIIDEYEKYEKNEYTDDAKNKKEELIFDMYLSGLEPVEIAKKMKMGVGEVQLIIDLMKRQ